MGVLLFDERPIVVDRKLAKAIGLKEAIVVQQIHYWIVQNEKAGRNFRDGRYWTYNSYPKWTEEFGLWCERTVKSIFSALEKSGILMSGNYNKSGMDQTKWYTINYDVLFEVCGKSPSGRPCPMDRADPARPIPEINTESNNTDTIAGFQPPHEREHKNPDPEHLFSKYGERRLFAMSDFVDWYIDKAYKNITGEIHRKENSYKRFKFAGKLLDCADELYLTDDDIKKTVRYAVKDMRDNGCGYMERRNGDRTVVDPLIYYMTDPGVLGYWLVTSNTVTLDELRNTKYHSIKETFYD